MYEKKYASTTTKSGGGVPSTAKLKKVAQKRATGTGYTATATNRSTGKKTTTSGTLTPTTKSAFNAGSSGKKVAKRRAGVGTNSSAISTSNTNRANRKLY